LLAMMSILWRWCLTALRISSHAWALYSWKHKRHSFSWVQLTTIYMEGNHSFYSL